MASRSVISRVIDVASVGTTVTTHVAIRLVPSVVLTVITASPIDFAVTTPSSSVATLSSDDDQATILFEASSGNTVTPNCIDSSTLSSTSVLSKIIFSASIIGSLTTISFVIIFPFELAINLNDVKPS